MKYINQKYKIIKKMEHERLFTSYFVKNMMTGKVCTLKSVHRDYIPEKIIDYYTENFFAIFNLSNKYIQHVEAFFPIFDIDGRHPQSGNYIFVQEPEVRNERFAKCKDKMQVFINLCKALNYLHINGYCYEFINEKNVFIRKGKVKLRSLIEVSCLEKIIPTFSKNNIKKDIRNLVRMVIKIDDSLLPSKVAEKAIYEGYGNLNELVSEINSITGSEYCVADEAYLNKVNIYVPIVGRKKEKKKINKSISDFIINRKKSKNYIISGKSGVGKTRLLTEIYYKALNKNINIYKASLAEPNEESNKSVWMSIIKKVMSDTDINTFEKYKIELERFFPALFGNKGKPDIDAENALRRIHRISGFIREGISERPTVIIIDNIENADSVSMEIIRYLTRYSYDNIRFIFTYNPIGNRSELCDAFIKRTEESKAWERIELKLLNCKETGQLIKSCLSLPWVPEKFEKQIYKITHGDPIYIYATIRWLLVEGKIHRSLVDGSLIIDFDSIAGEEDPKELYDFIESSESVSKMIESNIERMGELQRQALTALSFFRTPVSEKILSIYLEDKGLSEILTELAETEYIICRKYENEKKYYIDSTLFRNALYNKVSDEKKREIHKKIVGRLEENGRYRDMYDEFFYHINKAGLDAKMVKYRLENAERMHKMRNLAAEIENCKLAIASMKAYQNRLCFDVLLRIGRLYYEKGKRKEAINYYKKAEKIIDKVGDKERVAACKSNIAAFYYLEGQYDKVEEYCDAAASCIDMEKYTTVSCEIMKLRACIVAKTDPGLYKIDWKPKKGFAIAEKNCQKIIEKLPQQPYSIERNRTLGLTYILQGYMYCCKEQEKKAIECIRKAEKILSYEKNTLTPCLMVAKFLQGNIYREFIMDYEKAEQSFREILDLAEENGVENEIIALSLINIGLEYFETGRYRKSCYYLKEAFELSEIKHWNSCLFKSCCELSVLYNYMGIYDEGYKYFKKAEMIIGKEKPEIALDDYYYAMAVEYMKLGDFEKARIGFEGYADSTIGDLTSISKQKKDYQLLNNIRLGKDADGMEIVKKVTSCRGFENNISRKVDFVMDMALILNEKGDNGDACGVLDTLKNFDKKKLRENDRFNILLAEGICRENGLEELKRAGKYADDHNIGEAIIKINMRLCQIYKKMGNIKRAEECCLKACLYIKILLKKVPEGYKESFLMANGYGEPFRWVLESKKQELLERKESICELIEHGSVEELLRTEKLIEQLVNKSIINYFGKPVSKAEILSMLYDYPKDFEANAAKYLMSLILADRCIIVFQEKNGEFKKVYSSDEHETSENRALFRKVSQTGKPYYTEDNIRRTEQWNPENGIRAAACIPLKRKKTNDKYVIYGYIYLETAEVINNFREEGIKRAEAFANIISLIFERNFLIEESCRDKLTGLYCRKFFCEEIIEEAYNAEKNGGSFSIIMYDIDHFKRVNDVMGHEMGDVVLREVSEIVKSIKTKGDIVARFGGEEFMVLAKNTDSLEALEYAERIRMEIANRKILGEKFSVTVSTGIVNYPTHTKNVVELLRYVDIATYRSKNNGRNKSTLWNSSFEKSEKTNINKGYISGESDKDERNIKTVKNMLELAKSTLPDKKKRKLFMREVANLVEADYCSIIWPDKEGNITKTEELFTGNDRRTSDFEHSDEVIEEVLRTGKGVYELDWNRASEGEYGESGIVVFSIMCVPVKDEDGIEGIMYFSALSERKEFTGYDFNYVKMLGDILLHMM